jgi:DNA polymerase III delta subunit
MGSFAQWKAAADKGEIRRCTWICGDQRVLVEEVVDTIRDFLGVSDLDYHSRSASANQPREIWAAANQYPLAPGANRLVLVRDVEKLTGWEPWEGWLNRARYLPDVYLVLVSGEADFPNDDAGKHRVELAQAKRRLVQMVRCAMPNEADAIAWARQRGNLDEDMARHLLTRAGGDLRVTAGVCAKLSLFPGRPGKGIINELCEENSGLSFVDALLNGNKPAALRALPNMDELEWLRVLGLLDSRLDTLATLWKAVRSGYTQREVTGMPVFLVRQYMPVAKHYDPQRCVYARRVLAVIDNAVRSGARGAAMESLVALW